jgi:hypothetical protein
MNRVESEFFIISFDRVAANLLCYTGALATLFALEAAADDQLPKPVTCITSGAPKVGNVDFLQAFESLERQNKLRCFQVANDRDPVTLSPPQGACNPLHALLCQRRGFRHVGLHLKLREHGFIIIYPPKPHSYLGILFCDWIHIGRACIFFAAVGVLLFLSLTLFFFVAIPIIIVCMCISLRTSRKHHTQLKYIRRLEYNKEELDKLDLDELNEERWQRPTYRFNVLRVHGRFRQLWCCRTPKHELDADGAEHLEIESPSVFF